MQSYKKNFNFQNYYDRLLKTLKLTFTWRLLLRSTQFDGYKVAKKQKTTTLVLPFEYFIAPFISPSGRSNEPELWFKFEFIIDEPELSMRDRLHKCSHNWLGIDRVTPVNWARNTAIVVKSGEKKRFLHGVDINYFAGSRFATVSPICWWTSVFKTSLDIKKGSIDNVLFYRSSSRVDLKL